LNDGCLPGITGNYHMIAQSRKFGGSRRCEGGVDLIEDHAATIEEQGATDLKSDALSCAGDDGGFALQSCSQMALHPLMF
jgi:hypothetical protein